MSTLHTSEQTHLQVLLQPAALESVSADIPTGRDETGRGRGRKAAAGVQHGRGEIRQPTSAGERHPTPAVSGEGVRARESSQNRVFVLDRHGRPLMPCHPGRARQLLAAGRARVVRSFPFVIRLVDRTVEESVVDGVQVGVDPGSRTTGVAVFRSGSNVDGPVFRQGLVLVEIHHRGRAIRDKLTARAAYRRGRRSRNLRYRAPRFSNRKRPKGWLAPSLQHRVDSTMSWMTRLKRWTPVTGIQVESVRFDTQLLENPDLVGVDYQRGDLYGYEVREYVFAKWGHGCIYCGITNVALNLDHLHPKARGGSDRASNRAPACIPCNQLKAARTLEDFLAHDPTKLARIKAKMRAPLADAAAVNTTRNALVVALAELGVPVDCGTGGRTKWNRTRCDIPKTHALDALCVGEFDHITTWPSTTLTASSTGRGVRQRTLPDRYGFPRLTRPRTKRHHGYATGDLVRAVVPTGLKAGTHTGRVAVRSTGSFNIRTHRGTMQGIHHRHCQLIQRADGWHYTHTPTTSGLTARTPLPPGPEETGFPGVLR